ncbi:MAG: hypothetical protein EB130_03365 [Actinobacteria bacterium]|jgi:hypothetical protein|nr:hypothetical protein [Actinomycetota bacterium]
MAETVRADILVPEIWNPYIEEQTTLRNTFINSGVVQPMAELNATEGGDFVELPHWVANLSGDAEVLSDSGSLTPGNITADKQRAVVLHRGRAWGSRDLAAMAAGSDPLAAIGNKVAAYIANEQQKDLLACVNGAFATALSSLTVATAEAYPTAALVSGARAKLGDQGEKLSVMALHSSAYYELVTLKALDYVSAAELGGGEGVVPVGGSRVASFGDVRVPTYLNMRVVVSDDLGANDVLFFTAGAIASGQQAGLRSETDRDILAKASYISFDWHNVFHPIGVKYVGTGANPNRTALATGSNWEQVFEDKNVGIIKGYLND